MNNKNIFDENGLYNPTNNIDDEDFDVKLDEVLTAYEAEKLIRQIEEKASEFEEVENSKEK